MSEEEKPLISVENVSKRFGDFYAAREMSFAIGEGEFFAMLGPSGCGKTTMLRMIAGFEEPTHGAIRLDGQDMTGVPPYRRPVNTVFQNYALFPHLSVFDNVAFGPRMRDLDKARIDKRVKQMIEVVRLGDLAQRMPSQLSGGQRQRVALARALVNDPKALLLDEPLSALDLDLRRQMQIELKRIQRDVGITFIFVTHDQEEALTMSDRIAVMRAGRLEQVGTPEGIYEEPETAFVARFIGHANLIPVTVERAAGEHATIELPGGGRCEVATHGRAFEAGARALLMVRPERIEVCAGEPLAGKPRMPVTCIDIVFQGAVERCAVRTANGDEVIAHLESDKPVKEARAGAALFVYWEPDAARLLPLGGA
ncbi:MAG TPA: ABC transporter ATP-binding protein [Myxococcota bacterium]|nr:ABC transporter ATP-binding protein [Myxococcota bacterium]